MDSEWTNYPLPDLVDFQEGPGILAKDFRDDGVPLIRVSGFERGASLLAGCNYLDPKMVSHRWAHFLLQKGDILLTASASLGRTAVVTEDAIGAIPYTGIIRMRPRDERLFAPFLRYLLQGRDFQAQAMRQGDGSVIKHFGPFHLRRMKLSIPPIPEQRKIAAILYTIDDNIQNTQQIIDSTEELEKGLMQQLLTRGIGHTRFKQTEIGEMPEEWEVVNVGDKDVCEVVGGSTPSTKVPEYWDGDIPWATPTDITPLKTNYIEKTAQSITEKGLKNSGTKILPVGSILMTSRASIGYCAINTVPMTTNQGFASLVCGPKTLNKFIFYKMLTLRPLLERLANASTFGEVSKSSIRILKIALPQLPEQKHITHLLSTVDARIIKERQRKTQLEQLKRDLMQVLLTGKVRVKVDESEVKV